jgi:hypothetical protein
MGKAVITLVDEADGTVHIDVEFDPVIDMKNEAATAAQIYALKMLDAVATPEDRV